MASCLVFRFLSLQIFVCVLYPSSCHSTACVSCTHLRAIPQRVCPVPIFVSFHSVCVLYPSSCHSTACVSCTHLRVIPQLVCPVPIFVSFHSVCVLYPSSCHSTACVSCTHLRATPYDRLTFVIISRIKFFLSR